MVDKAGDKGRRRRGRKGEKHGEKARKGVGRKSGEYTASNGNSKTLLIHFTDDAPTWYSCGRQTPGRDDTLTSDPPSKSDPRNPQLVSRYRSRADELYAREVQKFKNSGAGSSDDRWVENTMKRGTLKDRIAAMSVVVSTNPVHKFYAIDGLMQMVGGTQTNARMAQMAAEALEDLFLRTLLPPSRKLVSLDQRPLYRYEGQKTLSPRVLLLWRYEEMVKEKYQQFLNQYLIQTLKDGMDISKLAALRTASTLLRSTPEGESQLLGMIVNKLGDPSKKIASTASHELRKVLEQHANMQVIVAREVQQLAHRPHLSPRALYNCIIFLNQLQLSADPGPRNSQNSKSYKPSLPVSLIKTYFCLFEVAVSKNKEDEGMKSRLLSALLTGVNRAYPFLPEKDKDLEVHMDSLYRVVHAGPPSATTQALMLLFHVAVGSGESATAAKKNATARQDRFYRALYATMSQPSTVASGKHLTMYFNLLYKAMKHDTNESRVNAFAKRLLCTTIHTSPPVTAASLFLLNEIIKYHPNLKSCVEDIAEGRNATAVLDPLKREPSAALTVVNDDSNDDSNDDDAVLCAPLWEASLLSHHFHPSVAKFASTVGEITYSGDPLKDFSLQPFLDKFAYRNPKSAKKSRGESVVERRRKDDASEQLPVNDPSFLEKTNVEEQDEFFRKFFVERARRDELKGIVRGNKAAAEDEDEAFDMVEDIDLDHHFEEGWDTDEEEEAFVDSLAQKLIDDAAGDLDDEDPDMEGWDDMYSDGDEHTGERQDDDDSADDDAFMERMEDDSDEESDLDDPRFDDVDDEDDAFMDADDDDSDSGDDEVDVEGRIGQDEDEDSDPDDLVLVEDASDDSDEDDVVVLNKKQKSNEKHSEAAFADASEYQEMINKGWQELNRPPISGEHSAEDVVDPAPSGRKKKRKRRSKKKKTSS